MHKYFRIITGVGSGNYVYFWKSKGLTDKKFILLYYSIIFYSINYSITPAILVLE